ncbi:MAG: hypothetical protein J7J76_06095 [Candidatus Latescibacteria bacterium]|nr:hypothetical protein [Candidatus Latescibacterota bacterium]
MYYGINIGQLRRELTQDYIDSAICSYAANLQNGINMADSYDKTDVWGTKDYSQNILMKPNVSVDGGFGQ